MPQGACAVPHVDAERRRWLESIAAACERILADEDVDTTDAGYTAVMEDVAALLERVTAERLNRSGDDLDSDAGV